MELHLQGVTLPALHASGQKETHAITTTIRAKFAAIQCCTVQERFRIRFMPAQVANPDEILFGFVYI
jgi:hypothetical protein